MIDEFFSKVPYNIDLAFLKENLSLIQGISNKKHKYRNLGMKILKLMIEILKKNHLTDGDNKKFEKIKRRVRKTFNEN